MQTRSFGAAVLAAALMLPLVAHAAAAAHRGETSGRHQGANQDRAGAVLGFADEIDTPMDAVRAVDIHAARRSEHHRVARGRAAIAVRRRVALVIGFNLDDRSSDTIDEKCRADQIGRHIVDAAGKEAWR